MKDKQRDNKQVNMLNHQQLLIKLTPLQIKPIQEEPKLQDAEVTYNRTKNIEVYSFFLFDKLC